ncbi:MAG: NUDIX domain-containing protein [Candidatus Eremiobacteraeota bacterium]|nr:NUDIX domain-containing protein [Candidatus Eremiobacteraeota bacterium]
MLRFAGADAEVLLLRRAGGAFAGAWTFVMGGVEDGERATDAARRELLEETALTATALFTAGELDAFYDPVRDRIVHVPFFVVYVDAGGVALETDVHDEHRWVTFAQAAELLEFASQRRVLDDIHRDFVSRRPQPWRTIR